MIAQQKTRISAADCLAWEWASVEQHEYRDGDRPAIDRAPRLAGVYQKVAAIDAQR